MEEVKKEVKKAKPEQKKRTGNSVTGKPLDQIDTKPQLDSVTSNHIFKMRWKGRDMHS